MFLDEGQNALATFGGKRYVPAPLPVPAAPALAAGALSNRAVSSAQFLGGGLAAGTYGYVLSYMWEEFEGPAGSEATVSWAGPSLGEVRLTLPALPAGVTGVNVYGRTPSGETLLARNAAGQLSAATFLDQGQPLDPQLPPPANCVFKRGGGRIHRIHVPGTGGTPGAVKVLDSADPTGAAPLATLFGPTTPAAGSITDVQAPCRAGMLVQFPAGMTLVLTYS